MTELPNLSLTMCVELIGERHELETFCRKHGDLLVVLLLFAEFVLKMLERFK